MPRNGKSKLILRIFGDPQNYVPRSKIALNKTLRKFVIFSQIRNYKRESIASIQSTFFVNLSWNLEGMPCINQHPKRCPSG